MGKQFNTIQKMKPEKNQSSQKLHAKKRRIKQINQINQLRMTTTNKIKVKWIPQLKRIKIKKVPKKKNQIKRQLQKMVAPQKIILQVRPKPPYLEKLLYQKQESNKIAYCAV